MSLPPGQGGGPQDWVPVGELSDRALVLRAQDGDADAFELFISRHQGRLFRIAYLILADRQDSEDVVQETLLTAWKRIDLLEDPAAARSWLSQICSRRALDVARLRARRGTDPRAPDALEAVTDRGTTSDPAQAAMVNTQMAALARVLAAMDPDLRSCWILREVDGMSYREIARTLDITEATARGRIARARTHVIDLMEEWR